MGISHHSNEMDPSIRKMLDELPVIKPSDAFKTFRKQVDDLNAAPSFPAGQISDEDMGETAFMIAADKTNGIIKIAFPKPMSWIGLGLQEARALQNLLAEKIRELVD